MPLTSGQTIINGKYHILKLIGEGGMARVWLAEEITFGNRQVALKEPRSDLLPDDLQELRRRYDREVKVCAALGQAGVPNIVPAITAEPYEGSVLLSMAYMPGGDLTNLLREHPDGLPIERAVTIALDVLRALHGAHEHALEIVHRDVKPSNILFDAQGRAHLGDFGLAQLAGMSQRSQLKGGQHPGTPLYMAPEQATSQDYLMPAADLYALGCVLFEMLTGTRYKRVRPGTPASSLRAEVPAWLDEVLARALAEDPWDRWESAAEMAEALEREEKTTPVIEVPAIRRTPSGLVIVSSSDDLCRLDPLPERILWERDGKEMVLVPAGPFLMGTPEEEACRLAKEEYEFPEFWLLRETPQREVVLEAYYVERTPVTSGEYARFLEANPSHGVPYLDPEKNPWAVSHNWDQQHRTPPPGREEHPVVFVSWHDAMAYADWAGKRLPTEAEWEKAARGTDGRTWPWGNTWDANKCNSAERLAGQPLRTYKEWKAWWDAWFKQDPVQRNQNTTRPVGAYLTGASPYGALDMAGNVWEWCADWYQGYPSTVSKSDEFGEKYRVLHGGSWYFTRGWARCADRYWLDPDTCSGEVGFRCCVLATSSL